jgi:hypothetical protein
MNVNVQFVLLVVLRTLLVPSMISQESDIQCSCCTILRPVLYPDGSYISRTEGPLCVLCNDSSHGHYKVMPRGFRTSYNRENHLNSEGMFIFATVTEDNAFSLSRAWS